MLEKNDKELETIIKNSIPLLDIRIEDLYLTNYALKLESIEKARKHKEELISSKGSQDTIKKVNEKFTRFLNGDKLFDDPKHGSIIPTKIGREFSHIIDNSFKEMMDGFHRIRVDSGKVICIGATQFMMNAVTTIYPEWKKNISDVKIDLQLIRSAEVESSLIGRKTDLVFGATIGENNKAINISKVLDFYPINRDRLGILTNIKDFRLEKPSDFINYINNYKKIIPEQGIIHDYVKYIPYINDDSNSNNINWCNDIFFGISILKNNISPDSFMFILEGAANWTQYIWKTKTDKRFPKLSFHLIPDGILEKEVLVGLLKRKDSNALPKNHPIQKCWTIFEDYYKTQISK